MIKLSIVIPVYNVEKYIEKCIRSIITQRIDDKYEYEILIVNDGTKDDSMSIVSKFTADYNIRVINKENGGLSSARNLGLKYCIGDYVWFVDSDDTIPDESLNMIFRNIEKTSSEVLFFDIFKVDEATGSTCYKKMYASEESLTKSGIEWMLTGDDIWPMAQMYVFKKQFLDCHHLVFKEGILHEDVEFRFRFMAVAKYVTYIPCSIYNYLLRNSGSISSGFNVKRVYDLRDIVLSEIDYAEKSLEEHSSKLYLPIYRNFENFISFVVNNNVTENESHSKDVYKVVKPHLKTSLTDASMKYKCKIILAIISLSLLKMFIKIRNLL